MDDTNPTFEPEDSGERRRQQNRNAQRRHRQRQKASGQNLYAPNLSPTGSTESGTAPQTVVPTMSMPDSYLGGYNVAWHPEQYFTQMGHQGDLSQPMWPLGFDQRTPEHALHQQSIGAVSQAKAFDAHMNQSPHPQSMAIDSVPMDAIHDINAQRKQSAARSSVRPSPGSSDRAAAGTSSTSTGDSSRRESEDRSKPSDAEKAIAEVQVLYNLGTRAGLLKREDSVKQYLANMKRIYRTVRNLEENDEPGPSDGSDRDSASSETGC